MNRRYVRHTGLVLGGLAVAALANSFTWIGGTTGNWNDNTQWTAAFPESTGWPDDANDDAVINTEGFEITVHADVTIDDLVLTSLGYSGGRFDAEDEERTITCDTLTITDGGNNGVVMAGLAGIETDD